MSQFTVQDLRNKISVTVVEAAILLSMGERTLKRHLSNGTGPIPTRRDPLTFRVSELERWEAAQEKQSV